MGSLDAADAFYLYAGIGILVFLCLPLALLAMYVALIGAGTADDD